LLLEDDEKVRRKIKKKRAARPNPQERRAAEVMSRRIQLSETNKITQSRVKERAEEAENLDLKGANHPSGSNPIQFCISVS